MDKNPLDLSNLVPEGFHESVQGALENLGSDLRKLADTSSGLTSSLEMPDSAKDFVRTIQATDKAVEQMQEYRRKQEQKQQKRLQQEKEANQAQIDSLPVQKEMLEEQKKNVQVSVHSARVALVSAVIAVVALVCQIGFFLLLR